MKNICVYCGSNPGRLEAYADGARALAKALVTRDLGLVYGGASVGIMGRIADAVLQLGGRAVGVIPEALKRKEIEHKGLTELHVTASMHERKTLMADLSDGFIALPGGIGTLEEIFEVWTWAQLGFHAKPCGLLNVAGYYDGLTTFLDHTVAEQFVRPDHRSTLLVEPTPDALLDRFASYQAPSVQKWVEKSQAL
ncbi:TIGR00730 family Rossman fold protein [Rhodoferax sp.]|uniref:LOG family protein n=1 Tax=Rhodoferax sp. TaxID=50421 RepID=UPI00283C40EF|nr:TIGR00730 family Rossman fold protein [Rhodoferax sp.]MDR3371230.1 TIGR00730 family Rossman fold protein [Rhodoferax sp.]